MIEILWQVDLPFQLGMDEGFDFRRTSGLVTSCYVIYSLLFLLLMILRRLEWKMFKTGRKKEVVGPCFSRLLNGWEVDLVEWFLLSLHRKRVSSKAGDKVIWIRSKNGKFFVKALYIALELGCTTLFPACVIWNSWVSLKVSFFACKAILSKVLTLDHLKRRGWSLENRCFLC